jgi:hypothetical protein
MNKLYKYLPFGIQGMLNEVNKAELIGINYYQEKLILKSGWSFEEVEYDEFKPILRPFEDLIKELPLTKAAAEMIGLKESELVIPIDLLSQESNFNWQHKSNSENEFLVFTNEKDLDFLRAMKFAIDFKECDYIKLTD